MKIVEKEGFNEYYGKNEYGTAMSYRVRKPDLMSIDPVIYGCRLNGILLKMQNPSIFIDTVPESIKVECGNRMVRSSKFNFYLSDLEIITLSIDSESMKPMSILDINISREE